MSISDFRGARHLNRRIHEHLRLPGCADHTSCTAHKMEVRIRLGPIYGLPVLCRLGIGSSWFLSQTSPISLHPPPQRHPNHSHQSHPSPNIFKPDILYPITFSVRPYILIFIYLSIWRIFSNRQFVLLICRHIDQYKDISGYQINYPAASTAPHSTQCPQLSLPVPLQIEPLRYSQKQYPAIHSQPSKILQHSPQPRQHQRQLLWLPSRLHHWLLLWPPPGLTYHQYMMLVSLRHYAHTDSNHVRPYSSVPRMDCMKALIKRPVPC